jgi:soluble lytic murein transglycosylase-like protein
MPFLALCSIVLFGSCSSGSFPESLELPPSSPWIEQDPFLSKEATFNGVPVSILDRLIQSESSWLMHAESRSHWEHSVGLAQVNLRWLSYFKACYGLKDPRNPAQAIDFASRYLADLYHATGSWYEAVLAYKCGLAGRHNAPEHIKRISRWVVGGEEAR